MMISNWIKPFGLHGLYKNNSALEWLTFLIEKKRESYDK